MNLKRKNGSIYLQEKFYIENKNFAETKIQEDVLSIQPPQWILDDPFKVLGVIIEN